MSNASVRVLDDCLLRLKVEERVKLVNSLMAMACEDCGEKSEGFWRGIMLSVDCILNFSG